MESRDDPMGSFGEQKDGDGQLPEPELPLNGIEKDGKSPEHPPQEPAEPAIVPSSAATESESETESKSESETEAEAAGDHLEPENATPVASAWGSAPELDLCAPWNGRIFHPVPDPVRSAVEGSVAALWNTPTEADPSFGETLRGRLRAAAQKRFSAEWQGPEITHAELAADSEAAFWLAFQRVRRYWDRKSAPERDIFLWIGWEQISRDACGACLGATAPKAYEHVVQIKKVMGPLCYRCPWNQARPQRDTDARLYRSCGWECLFQLDQAIMEAGERLAGVILAPLVQRQGGMVMFPPGYLRGVRERCESSRVPFIADETASAFGRTGSFFACEQEAVRPDLLIIGASLGNGVLPIGAVLGSEPIMNDCSAGACGACPAGRRPDHGSSVAAGAALGMMDHLEDFWGKETTAELSLALRKQAERFWDIPFVGDIRCCGMIAAIELVGNWKTRKQFSEKRDIGRKICARAHRAGLHVPHLGDVLVLAPPFGMNSAQLEEATDTLLEATMEVLMADEQSISSDYPGDDAESHRKGS